LLTFEGGAARPVKSFDAPITALACFRDGGAAVALRGREVRLYARPVDDKPKLTFSTGEMRSINALSACDNGDILATDGSAAQDAEQWVRDLLERGRTGRVLRLDAKSGEIRVLASGFRYAFGVCADGADVLASESWRSRVVRISAAGAVRAAVDNLPVYPSRLSPAGAGGFWVTAFRRARN
jgi:sugar lactone lactonase YvrE